MRNHTLVSANHILAYIRIPDKVIRAVDLLVAEAVKIIHAPAIEEMHQRECHVALGGAVSNAVYADARRGCNRIMQRATQLANQFVGIFKRYQSLVHCQHRKLSAMLGNAHKCLKASS